MGPRPLATGESPSTRSSSPPIGSLGRSQWSWRQAERGAPSPQTSLQPPVRAEVEDTATLPGRGPGSPRLCWMLRPRVGAPLPSPCQGRPLLGPYLRSTALSVHRPRHFLKVSESGPQLGAIWRQQLCPGSSLPLTRRPGPLSPLGPTAARTDTLHTRKAALSFLCENQSGRVEEAVVHTAGRQASAGQAWAGLGGSCHWEGTPRGGSLGAWGTRLSAVCTAVPVLLTSPIG